MTEGVKPLRFFLGANTPRGFVSRFDQLERREDGWNRVIIKGGPGTGKSSLMKKIAAAFLADAVPGEKGRVEEIYCSSDCLSLDGVILHSVKTSIADGTAPHTIEPKYHGAYDTTLNLSECWNEDLLCQNREEIISLSKRISSLHAQSTRFLAAYGALNGDNARIALEATDVHKAAEYARHFASRELRGVPREQRSDTQPHEDVRFLSAISDRGVVVFEETARMLADRLFVVEDPWGASARILLGQVRRLALERGLDVISCYCPTDPDIRLEHLFIPALSVGLMTRNRIHPLDVEPFRVIHARRFTDMEAMRLRKQRLAFNRRGAAEMLRESTRCLSEAKALHDTLESYYIEAMDFTLAEEKMQRVLHRLRRERADV